MLMMAALYVARPFAHPQLRALPGSTVYLSMMHPLYFRDSARTRTRSFRENNEQG